jgi:hypothetical protein
MAVVDWEKWVGRTQGDASSHFVAGDARTHLVIAAQYFIDSLCAGFYSVRWDALVGGVNGL